MYEAFFVRAPLFDELFTVTRYVYFEQTLQTVWITCTQLELYPPHTARRAFRQEQADVP